MALAIGLLVANVSASVVPMTLEQMVAISDAVVVVRVENTESTIQTGKIFTTANLQVLESLKGKVGEQESLVYPGGKYGKLVMAVPEVPTFSEGEEAILFLSKPIDRLPKAARSQYKDSPMKDSYSVVGGFQGKIGVVNLSSNFTRARSGRVPIPAEAKVARANAGGAAAGQGVLDYEAVRSSLKTLVQKQQAKEATRGALDKVAGVRGAFAVPARSDDPVIRSFDPLPALAYKSDKEIAKLKADLKTAEDARASRRQAEDNAAEADPNAIQQ